MICAISASSPWYRGDDPRMEWYRAAGLEFEQVWDRKKRVWWELKPCTREFTTVGELLAWQRVLGQELILSADGSIEIYDDYRE